MPLQDREELTATANLSITVKEDLITAFYAQHSYRELFVHYMTLKDWLNFRSTCKSNLNFSNDIDLIYDVFGNRLNDEIYLWKKFAILFLENGEGNTQDISKQLSKDIGNYCIEFLLKELKINNTENEKENFQNFLLNFSWNIDFQIKYFFNNLPISLQKILSALMDSAPILIFKSKLLNAYFNFLIRFATFLRGKPGDIGIQFQDDSIYVLVFSQLCFYFETMLRAFVISYQVNLLQNNPSIDISTYLVHLLLDQDWSRVLSTNGLIYIDTQIFYGKQNKSYLSIILAQLADLLQKDQRSSEEDNRLRLLYNFVNRFTGINLKIILNYHRIQHRKEIEKIFRLSVNNNKLSRNTLLSWAFSEYRTPFFIVKVVEDNWLDYFNNEQLFEILTTDHEFCLPHISRLLFNLTTKNNIIFIDRFRKRLDKQLIDMLFTYLYNQIKSNWISSSFNHYCQFLEFIFGDMENLSQLEDGDVISIFGRTHHYWFIDAPHFRYWMDRDYFINSLARETRLWYRLLDYASFRTRLVNNKLFYRLTLISQSATEYFLSNEKFFLLKLNYNELSLLKTRHPTLSFDKINSKILRREQPIKQGSQLNGQSSLREKTFDFVCLSLLLGVGLFLLSTGLGGLLGIPIAIKFLMLISSYISYSIGTMTTVAIVSGSSAVGVSTTAMILTCMKRKFFCFCDNNPINFLLPRKPRQIEPAKTRYFPFFPLSISSSLPVKTFLPAPSSYKKNLR